MPQAIRALQSEIVTLQEKLDQLMVDQRVDELKKIIQCMHAFSISPEDISTAFANSPRESRQPSTNRGPKRPPVPPKYRHPETGQTWTGRGRPPRWLSAEERAGVARDRFLINNEEA